MPPELPRISGDDAIKVLIRLGFYEVRQKGSRRQARRHLPDHQPLGERPRQAVAAGDAEDRGITALHGR
jgi:predicted RNA binding protein YcfA (HicA-like mRNA interferase family)